MLVEIGQETAENEFISGDKSLECIFYGQSKKIFILSEQSFWISYNLVVASTRTWALCVWHNTEVTFFR